MIKYSVGDMAILRVKKIQQKEKNSLAKSQDTNSLPPDLRSGVGGDADSCYLSNPHDLSQFLQQRGCKILSAVGGKSEFLGPFSSNIQIVAKEFCKG